MLKIIYYSLFISAVFIFTSCSKESSDDNTEKTITVSDLLVSINENPQNGEVIGTVQASTNSGSLSFAVLIQEPAGAISIDNSGQIKVANASLFDYEVNSSISGTIRATNGNVSKELSFDITIIDVEESLVCEQNVFLMTQQEVDAFGQSGCTIIDGVLVIGSFDNPNNSIVDLSPLSNITKVTQFLVIQGNSALETLAPLSNITEVGSSIQIRRNPLLQNLEGLNGITKIKGPAWTEIRENESLINLQGLNNLVELENAIIGIWSNPSLQNFNGLENLTTMGPSSGLDIVANHNLLNIDALQGLNYIGHLTIKHNQNLSNLEGLKNVSAAWSITIEAMPIDNLEGLRSLNTTRYLTLKNNFNLIDIADLIQLSNCEFLTISENPLLQSLNGLQNIHTLNNLNINKNNSLIDLTGLSVNEFLGERIPYFAFSISSNSSLTNIDALSSVTTIKSVDVTIQDNPLINNLDGLSNLVFDNQFSQKISIVNNQHVTDLCGLTTITNLPQSSNYNVTGNGYNPTYNQILNGNCSL